MWLVIPFILVLVFLFASSSVKIIRQSEVAIVERLGKYSRTASSGLNIVVPILDKIATRIDLRTQVIDSPLQPVITKDNVTMSIDTVVYFQVTDPFKATYEIQNLVQAIRYLTTTTLRDIIGTMELDETLSSRENINNRLRIVLDEATDKWGVRVERVEVKNIDLPPDIKDAMEKQMRAEREKRAAILQAEGERQAAVTQAQGHKEAQILNAEAEKEAKIRRSEGEAQAIKKVAQAEADKIKFIFTALKEANIDEKMLSVKYIEVLQNMAAGPNKVFVPYESSALIGALGSLKEVLKENK
ncbi:MAG: SPFH/Band 7/PHB domain protein [Clostridia bacterium]|nr:SPFH/Band 7/PHB domain protein [Clostridia bacterium]